MEKTGERRNGQRCQINVLLSIIILVYVLNLSFFVTSASQEGNKLSVEKKDNRSMQINLLKKENKKNDSSIKHHRNIVNYKNDFEFDWRGNLFALGDLHGDYNNTIRILRKANLIDRSEKWIANDTLLIQVGDIWDRGPDGALLHSLFDNLEKQAAQKGSKVIRMMGIHELLNMEGQYFYVHPDERGDGYDWVVQRMQGFSPYGKYGKAILNMPVCIKVNKTVFMHAGIELRDAKKGIKYLNVEEKQKLRKYFESLYDSGEKEEGKKKYVYDDLDDRKDVCLLDSKGVLWTRELATGAMEDETIDEILSLLNAEHIVIGHTVRSHVIGSLYNERVLCIDTGLSRYVLGAPSILKIADGNKFEAIYCDGYGDTQKANKEKVGVIV